MHRIPVSFLVAAIAGVACGDGGLKIAAKGVDAGGGSPPKADAAPPRSGDATVPASDAVAAKSDAAAIGADLPPDSLLVASPDSPNLRDLPALPDLGHGDRNLPPLQADVGPITVNLDAPPGPTVLGCAGEYNACGCGCCGGIPHTTSCYYPSLGDTVADIAERDRASKASQDCSLAGCSRGTRYVCCEPASPEPAAGTSYSADLYIGGYNRLTINKTGTHCAGLLFLQPGLQPDEAGQWRIDTPDHWVATSANSGSCEDAGAREYAIAALGSMVFRASGVGCVVDLHATLYFAQATGPVTTVRMDVDGLLVPMMSARECR